MPETTPFTARSKSASSKTMLGDLPPSSSVTVLQSARGEFIDLSTCRSAAGKADVANQRMRDQRLADLRSEPGNHVDHAFREAGLGKSAASSTIDADVNSDGLTTAVHPAASAGANFQLVNVSGEFQGVMMATTPFGSYFVYAKTPFLSVGMTELWILSVSPA